MEKEILNIETVLTKMEEHLKTKEHRRKDLDFYVDGELEEGYAYNNNWGAQQEQGFREAMELISKI